MRGRLHESSLGKLLFLPNLEALRISLCDALLQFA